MDFVHDNLAGHGGEFAATVTGSEYIHREKRRGDFSTWIPMIEPLFREELQDVSPPYSKEAISLLRHAPKLAFHSAGQGVAAQSAPP